MVKIIKYFQYLSIFYEEVLVYLFFFNYLGSHFFEKYKIFNIFFSAKKTHRRNIIPPLKIHAFI